MTQLSPPIGTYVDETYPVPEIATADLELPSCRQFEMVAGLGGTNGPLTAMAVLEPLFTASEMLEVILATEDGNVVGKGYCNLGTDSRRMSTRTLLVCGEPCSRVHGSTFRCTSVGRFWIHSLMFRVMRKTSGLRCTVA